MPTIIDSLVVKLSLDAKDFNKARNEATDSLKKTKDQAVSHGKGIEEANKKLGDTFSKIKNEALAFFAVLAGANSVKSFIANITASNTALGVLSANLALNPKLISTWGMAIERLGGNSDEAVAGIQAVSKALFALHNLGQDIPKEYRMIGQSPDTEHGVSKFIESLAAIAKAKEEAKKGEGYQYLKAGGMFGDTMIRKMLEDGAAVTKNIAALSNLAPSDASIKGAQDLTKEWVTLSQTIQSIGNNVLPGFEKSFGPILQDMTKWAEENRTVMETGLLAWIKDTGENVKILFDYLKPLIELIKEIDKWDPTSNAFKFFMREYNAPTPRAVSPPASSWPAPDPDAPTPRADPGGFKPMAFHVEGGQDLRASGGADSSGAIGIIAAGTRKGVFDGMVDFSEFMKDGGSGGGGGGSGFRNASFEGGPGGGGSGGRPGSGAGGAGGAGGGGFMDALAQIESGNRNIYSGVDKDYPGQPNSRSQGYFQIDTPTWERFAAQAGVDLSKYPNAMSAPRDVQAQVAALIPLSRFGPRTRNMLQRQFGPLNTRSLVGQLGGGGSGGGWNASIGPIPPDVLAEVQKRNPHLSPRQCVELIQNMGLPNVHEWLRGAPEKDAPERTPLATFGWHGDSDRYAYGGSGTPGIGRDHGLFRVKKYPDGSFDALSQDAGHGPHMIHIPWTGKGGEGDASSYFGIKGHDKTSSLYSPRHLALSSLAAKQPVMTSSRSNSLHVGKIEVTAGKGDADHIASNITAALQRSTMAWLANSGQV